MKNLFQAITILTLIALCTPEPTAQLNGTISPPFNHLLVNLTVQTVTATEDLEFIIDTSRQFTYLTHKALRELGGKRAVDAIVAGVGLRCLLVEHWMREMGRELNVLGMDFLVKAGMSIVVDNEKMTFALVKVQQQNGG